MLIKVQVPGDSEPGTLRGLISGYKIPAPFVAKSEEVTVVFHSDENNWGLPGYFEEYVDGKWEFKFTVIYPSTSTATVDTTTTEQTTVGPTTATPSGLPYSVNSGNSRRKQNELLEVLYLEPLSTVAVISGFDIQLCRQTADSASISK